MRWLGIILATMVISPALAADPDFSRSVASYAPAPIIAGDIVRYTVKVTNTGGDGGYTRITTTLPRGYLIRTERDCASASFDGAAHFTWHEGAFAAGMTKDCVVVLLTRRDGAGTRLSLVTEVSTPPNGYFQFAAAPDLASPSDPNAVRVGPIAVSQAGLAVMALLGIGLIGGGVVARRASRAGGDAKNSLGAWFVAVVSIGFLFYFAALAHNDWRSYSDYRQTSCFILDSAIRAFQGSGKSSAARTYSPEFAVRYRVDDVDTYSISSPATTAVSLGWIGFSRQQLSEYPPGSSHTCWFDPADIKTVLLVRGPGAAYFFALLPLITLFYAAWILRATARRDR